MDIYDICTSGLDGLLPTSDENFMSTGPLEIDLLGKMVKCSTRILPGVCQTLTKCQ